MGWPLVGGTYMPNGSTTSAVGETLFGSGTWPFRPFSGGSSGNSGEAAADGARDYQDYWDESNIVDDWAKHIDTYGHNEALAAYEREKEAALEAWKREATYNAAQAKNQRAFEEYMSNTAFQRKVADYVKAGFSPLAALEGSAGASTPSGVAASANAKAASAAPGQRGSNNFGSLLGAVLSVIAMVATKGISAASKAATSSAKAVAKASSVKTAAKQIVKEAAKEKAVEKSGMMLGGKWFSDEELYKIARTRWVK